MDNLEFSSNKSGYNKFILICFIIGFPLIVIFISIFNKNNENEIHFFLFSCIYLLILILIYNYWFNYKYIIKDQKLLYIKISRFEIAEINIFSIKSITNKRDKNSSFIYATSDMNIISIKTFNNKIWNISPLERNKFLLLIHKINPKIEINFSFNDVSNI